MLGRKDSDLPRSYSFWVGNEGPLRHRVRGPDEPDPRVWDLSWPAR